MLIAEISEIDQSINCQLLAEMLQRSFVSLFM